MRDKETTRKVALIFLNVKMLKEMQQRCFRGCKRTRKVQRIYLEFKNFKIRRKKCKKSKEKQETSKTDAFGD